MRKARRKTSKKQMTGRNVRSRATANELACDSPAALARSVCSARQLLTPSSRRLAGAELPMVPTTLNKRAITASLGAG